MNVIKPNQSEGSNEKIKKEKNPHYNDKDDRLMIRQCADDNEASWKDCGASYNSLHWHNIYIAIFPGSTGITK